MPTHARPSAHTVSVPHERHGVSLARHAFATDLVSAGVTDTEQDDAMLVLSELVGNAVRHAQPLPGGDLRVGWSIEDDTLYIAITDGGAGTRPNAAVAAVSAVGGRGLDIVRTVSRQWGVTEDCDTITVWADVPRDSPGLADRPPY